MLIGQMAQRPVQEFIQSISHISRKWVPWLWRRRSWDVTQKNQDTNLESWPWTHLKYQLNSHLCLTELLGRRVDLDRSLTGNDLTLRTTGTATRGRFTGTALGTGDTLPRYSNSLETERQIWRNELLHATITTIYEHIWVMLNEVFFFLKPIN